MTLKSKNKMVLWVLEGMYATEILLKKGKTPKNIGLFPNSNISVDRSYSLTSCSPAELVSA